MRLVDSPALFDVDVYTLSPEELDERNHLLVEVEGLIVDRRWRPIEDVTVSERFL